MKEKDKLQKEALEYFRQPVFQRIFEGFKEKYASFGSVGGKVVLTSLSEEEKDVLEGFLQRDCHHQSSITISAKKMEKALQNTKFAALSLEELLHEYFPEGLSSKKEIKEQQEQREQGLFESIEKQFAGTKAGLWFHEIITTKNAVYPLLLSDTRKNPLWVRDNIPKLLEAVNDLPKWQRQWKRLPVFASELSGNPHYFDEGERMFRYLLYGICYVCGKHYPKEQDAQTRTELLYDAGILRDDLWNFVTCMGVRGYQKSGEVHPGIEGFFRQGEMIQLNMWHLGQLKSLEPVGKRVYVVENPAIFQKLAEDIKGKAAIVCGNGQIRLAVLVLLDMLADSGAELWYAGDFDPEGLLIAQKLKKRFGAKVQFWHYDREDYEMAKSEERISEKRLKKLDSLEDAVLKEMGSWIKESGRAGYQENLGEEVWRIEI